MQLLKEASIPSQRGSLCCGPKDRVLKKISEMSWVNIHQLHFFQHRALGHSGLLQLTVLTRVPFQPQQEVPDRCWKKVSRKGQAAARDQVLSAEEKCQVSVPAIN